MVVAKAAAKSMRRVGVKWVFVMRILQVENPERRKLA
jgi:hypothetical protein